MGLAVLAELREPEVDLEELLGARGRAKLLDRDGVRIAIVPEMAWHSGRDSDRVPGARPRSQPSTMKRSVPA